MKALLGLIILIFLCIPLRAAEPGGWINEVTRDVQTPHLTWAPDLAGGSLRVLFLTSNGGAMHYQKPYLGARMVVEWAQRMDLQYEAVTAGRGLTADTKRPRLAFDLYHPRGYEGIAPDEKEAELARKLSLHAYELYIFHEINMNALAPEAKLQIVEAVLAGAGLVLIDNVQPDLPGLFKTPDSQLSQGILRLCSAPDAKTSSTTHSPLRSYRLGKGWIVQVTRSCEPETSGQLYLPEWTQAFAKLSPTQQAQVRKNNEAPVPLWWGTFETRQAEFMRIFYYAAGRKPQAALSCPFLETQAQLTPDTREIPLLLANPKELQTIIHYRIRNDENRVLQTGSAATSGTTVNLPLHALPAGDYTLDLRSTIAGKTDDFGAVPFSIQKKLRATVSLQNDRVHDGKPISFQLNLDGPVGKNLSAQVTLADSPYDRVWSKKHFSLTDASPQTLQLTDWYLPGMAGTLRIEILQEDTVVAYARKTVFRPQGNKPPLWFDAYWGESLTPLHGLMNQERQGWLGMTRAVNTREGSIPQYMLMGELCIPWGPLSNWHVFNKQHGRSVGYHRDEETGETRPNWTEWEGGAKTHGATTDEVATLEAMPAGMHERPAAVREVMRIWKRSVHAREYGATIFNLGDETMPGYDTFRGAYATREFQAFLMREYKTIDALNAAWNRTYESFAQIPLLTTAEATEQHKLPEGAAQRRFAEANYYDVYRTIGETLQTQIPGAYYGPTSCEYARGIVMPELNASFTHPETLLTELRRTTAPDSLSLPLFGYEIRQSAYSNKRFWQDILCGNARGHTWFAANVYAEGGTLCADFRDKMPKVTKARRLLQNGLGALLRSLTPARAHIAVLVSPASETACRLAPEFVSPANLTTEGLFRWAYARGIAIDACTPATLATRLAQYRTLVLPGVSAISQQDADRILRFVAQGGTVVADLNPGIYNADMGTYKTNPLAALFGDLKLASIQGANDYHGMQCPGVAGIEPFQTRTVGKGRAILMNTTLSDIIRACADPSAYDAFMENFAQMLGIQPAPVKVSGLPAGSLVRLFNGDGFSLLALANDSLCARGEGAKPGTVTFDKPGFIYRIGHGFVGKTDTVNVPFDPPFCFLTRFGEEQSAPPLRLSATRIAPGETIQVDLSGFAQDRILLLQILDAQGHLFRPRSESPAHELIRIGTDTETHTLHFSYSDALGEYLVTLLDVATGLSASATVILHEEE